MTALSASDPLRLLGHTRHALAAAAAFSVVINLLMLTVPLYMMQVYDRVLGSGGRETLVFLTLLALGLLVMMAALDAIRGRLLGRTALWIEAVLGPHLFERALEQRLTGAGGRMEALGDLAALRGFFTGPAVTALFDAPLMPVFLGVVFLLHPVLGLVALGGAVLLFGLGIVNDLSTRHALAAAAAAAGRAARQADAAWRNAEAVDGLGMLNGARAAWLKPSRTAEAAQQEASDRAGTLVALSKLLRLGTQVMMLAAGAWLVIDAAISPGAMIAASLIMGRGLAPVEQAIAGWRQAVKAYGALRKVRSLIASPARRARPSRFCARFRFRSDRAKPWRCWVHPRPARARSPGC